MMWFKRWAIGFAYLLLILHTHSAAASATSTTTQPPYNIILIISDQETHQLLPATDYQLPARQTLIQHGVTFTNHYTAAAMCTPSRAALLTGQTPQVTGIFDQMEYNFVPDLNPKLPNIGSVLKKLGYRTAFFGKFEMNKTLLASKATINYSKLAKSYGFDVFNYNGDVGGEPLQGYSVDSFFVGEAIQWLREQSTKQYNTPFFMVVSLLNPHDIMYGDANLPNTVQAQQPSAPVIMPPPANSMYAQRWQFSLPPSLQESLTAPGMPTGLNEYQYGWSKVLGSIPTDRTDMWTYYYNYYLNALRDNDRTLQLLINSIHEMDLWKNTVIIFTSDHGEMGGAHGGLRGKGPMAYEENIHIPLIIDHPKAQAGTKNNALTSHIDMLPTIIGLTGLPKNKYAELMTHFPGHDFSHIVLNNNQDIHAIRSAILFNYVGISTIDGHYLANMLDASLTHRKLPSLQKIDVSKRGFLMRYLMAVINTHVFMHPQRLTYPKNGMTSSVIMTFNYLIYKTTLMKCVT